jgi:hypothetical protein
MPSRRLHLFIVLFLAILALFLSLATFLLLFQPIKTLTRLGEGVEEAKKRFVSIAFPLLREERMELRMILNESHIEKARELGISDLDSEEKVRIACKKGKLVRLTDNRFWRIQELTHSLPYVTPDTYRLLVLIGARFQDASLCRSSLSCPLDKKRFSAQPHPFRGMFCASLACDARRPPYIVSYAYSCHLGLTVAQR